MIPSRLDALASSGILSAEGLARFGRESELPAAPEAGDESIASFVTRRMGREAYERLVEPLMSGIYAGDGEQLSLAATFPNLRRLEREYGSVTRGLLGGGSAASGPPFLSLRGGMHDLVAALADRLVGTIVVTGRTVVSVRRAVRGQDYQLELADGDTLAADAVVLATPAYVTAALVAPLDPLLAEAHAEIPYASTAVVTLAYPAAVLSRPLDGYGYVVLGSRAPMSSRARGRRASGRDGRLRARARTRLHGALRRTRCHRRLERGAGGLGPQRDRGDACPGAEPLVACIHRWPRGMPQYVLGSLERIGVIQRRLTEHPGLAVAGAAYHGVGIPDCIASGEQAAERVAAGENSWELAS
jgi:oxygen-dependent protoporphyrinogen oxidase